MTKSETWKDVVGYEGLYEVSNKGNVYSVERMDALGREQGGLVLKPKYNNRGYLMVSLYKNGKLKNRTVHRIVAEAFIPNPKGFLEINHKDENKSNNEIFNLEWCTREHNVKYGTSIERISKKVRAVNIGTGEVVTFNSTQEAGRKGYSASGVSRACRGTYKTDTGKLVGGDGRTYKGYKWYYE